MDFNDTTNRNLGLASVLDNSGTLLSSEDAITGKGYTEKIFNHTPVLKFTYFTMMIVCFVGLTGSIYWFNSKWVTINFKEKVISRLMDVSGAVPIVAFVLLIVVLILAFKSSDKKKKSNKNIKEFKNLGKEYRLLMRQNDLDSKKNKVTSEKRMKQIEIKVIELIKKE